MSNYFTVNSTMTFDVVSRNASVAAADLALWNATRAGPFSGTRSNTLGFLRVPLNSPAFKKFSDPSAGVCIPTIRVHPD